MGRYAVGTGVPVERTKAEIESALIRYKASEFVSGWKQGSAMIGFRINGLYMRFTLPTPDKSEKRFRYKDRRGFLVPATEAQAEAAYQQEIRSRWRALLLVIKAKLEAVECGISTIENEFMSFIVLADNTTLGEWVIENAIPRIAAGRMPPLLGPAPEKVDDAEIIGESKS